MTQPFSLEAFLPYRLTLVAAKVSDRLSSTYSAPGGLDVVQWRIVAHLASRGDLTAQDIVDLTQCHKSTVSRAVAALEEAGWVRRSVSARDKRAFVLQLTSAGHKLFQRLLPGALAFEKRLLGRLTEVEAAALRKGLAALERVVAESDAVD